MDHLWLYFPPVFILVVFLFLLISKKRGFFNNLFKRTLDKNLEEDSEKLLNELKELNPSKETINNFAVSFANQIFKYRFYGLIFAIIPTIFIFHQTILISNQNILIQRQNDKMDEQNEKIRMQVFLEEASRRNNLVLLMDNILEKVNDEITESTTTLSRPLIGRISALSQGFQPYYFLEDGELTEKQYSPERGQLLLALANSGIDTATLDVIYSKATFEKAYLEGANMELLYLKAIKMQGANLSRSNLRCANFYKADLSESKMEGAILRNTNLQRANLAGVNLKNASLTCALLTNADLIGSDLSYTILTGSDLSGANLALTNFKRSRLNKAILEGALVKDTSFFKVLLDFDLNAYKEVNAKYTIMLLKDVDSDKYKYPLKVLPTYQIVIRD